MMQNFEINSSQIDKIEKITSEERNFRIKNLKIFNETGFPNKKFEDWKFSDFNEIVRKNFDYLETSEIKSEINKINLIKDFKHNFIIVVNGKLNSSNFDHEVKNKIKVSRYSNNNSYEISDNPLISLNHALADNGYLIEVEKNYKLKKTLVIYNIFTKDIENKILNTKNKIKVGENSEIHLLDYTINNFKFINNVYENIFLEKNSKLKNLYIQNNNSEGYFHKFLKSKLYSNSDYSSLIFSSGLKFNKLDIECDLVEKNANCNILSALFLKNHEHQEIKTRINHLAPNCKSYQRVKEVVSNQSKGVYQGKIYVKDIAQKTDAYQLSKALLLNDEAEFNSKPELEIYADDVKCSHGSTSGNVDEDAIHYLMTRGLKREEATRLLIKGFLSDVIEFIKSDSIKKFVESILEKQVNGY